ncbi:MAG: copper resistance CopC family protein [Nakamurella sp.]
MSAGAGSIIRRVGAALAVTLLVALGGLAAATPALAHNVLVSSDPANGSTLDTAPTVMTFTFDQAIENFDPALKVFGPNGNEFTTAAPTVLGNAISAPMTAGPAGEYRAAYRIVSADGHPVTGQITFTLSAAAAGTAAGTPTGAANAARSTAANSDAANSAAGGADQPKAGGLGVWLWVIIGVAVVLIVVAMTLAVRKPRDQR